MSKKGFTIIETVIFIVVLGIVLAPFSILIVNVMAKNAYSQAWATSVAIAEGEMERVTNLRFQSVEGEIPVALFTTTNYQVNVDYVNANDLNTPVAGPTDYKRVQIVVNNYIAGTVTLTTLVTNDW